STARPPSLSPTMPPSRRSQTGTCAWGTGASWARSAPPASSRPRRSRGSAFRENCSDPFFGVKAIDRKLARDLWALKTQVVSIALVIACGIGGFIGTMSPYGSRVWSRDHYYDTARFAHVFASAKRAPQSLEERIRAIPGVVEVETRVVRDTQLSIPGIVPPMIARLIGYDFAHPGAMNRLTLRSGRWPAPGARGEVVVNQRFLEARGLTLGERMDVLMNGKLERLTIVGTALTPEYIYATRGGGMPDDEWFAVLWTDTEALAAAFN